MADKCYKLTRSDGEELGTFDRLDEAEQTAEFDARLRGYELNWIRYFGGAHGRATTSGRGVLEYKLEDVECD